MPIVAGTVPQYVVAFELGVQLLGVVLCLHILIRGENTGLLKRLRRRHTTGDWAFLLPVLLDLDDQLLVVLLMVALEMLRHIRGTR